MNVFVVQSSLIAALESLPVGVSRLRKAASERPSVA